jgi:hypothetical protein
MNKQEYEENQVELVSYDVNALLEAGRKIKQICHDSMCDDCPFMYINWLDNPVCMWGNKYGDFGMPENWKLGGRDGREKN